MGRFFKAAAAAVLGLALAACGRPPQNQVATSTSTAPLFTNGGFESGGGSLSGWTTTVYWNNGITYPPTSYADLRLQSCSGYTPGGTPDCTNRTSAKVNAVQESQQMTGLSGLASPRWPKFGTASAVVNEGGLRQNANSLKQQYTTTSADVDPADGKIHARFALSPQLQDPGHAANQQPYFYVILRNVTKGNTTLYQTFNYSNQTGIPWQDYDPGGGQTHVKYTDWQVFDVAPGNAVLMVGDTIELEVVAAGCQPNGHWGQVFVDGFGAQLPGLSIAKTAPQWVLANADLTYSFQVENATSFVARNVVANEVIPANTTFKAIVSPAGVTCTTPAVGATGTVSCPLGWMNPYSSQTFQVTVHTNSGLANNTVITNGNYSVSGDGINAILGPAVMTTIGNGPYADLAIAVTDGTPAVVWGGSVSYTITVTNNGPTTATNATVTDTFPAQLTGGSWTCAAAGGGSCGAASGSGNISATVTLPSGATATYTVTANVIAGSGNGTLTNTASVATPAGVTESNPSNNSDADTDSIGTLYAVTVTKDLVAETGRGQVVSSPSGISCGDACASQSVNFLDGSQVTLTAIARAGDAFDRWSGGCTGTGNICTVTLSGGPVSVAAHFRGPAVTGSVAAGSGTAVCSPSPVTQQTSSTCTLTPAAGWQLTALTDNGANVLASVSGGLYTLSGAALVNDHAVVATFMKSNATACGAGTECASGNCVDGACCNTACGGQCQACDVGGSVGTCTTVTSGQPHGAGTTRTACTGAGTTCGGTCDGSSAIACNYPTSSTSCRDASCSSGTATLAASCNGTGSCPAVQTQPCTPYICGATACLTACSSDSQCIAGDWCNAAACQPKKANGQTCSAANQCANGNCVDGVCCNTACGGQCQACDVGGSVGTCSPVTGAPHGPRSACTSDGSACGGACNGTNTSACAYPGSSTSCRNASCSSGTGTLAANCNGTGSCPAVQTQPCTPYVCGATACLTTCSSDLQCIAGDWCSAGTCQPKKANGQTCAAGNQCTSGTCADGVCCNSACNGQCQACDVAGSLGTCLPVTGAPHGSRTACASDGSVCGGSCDGTNTSACAYLDSATSCRDASCAAGVATLAASCDGAGSCPAPQTQACTPYICGATACLTSCSADGECAGGDYCSGGSCVPQKGSGETCGAFDECSSGFCVDGVCCDTACNGQCQACDVAGSAGTCSAVTGAPHGARPACASDGSVCGGSCDGTGTGCCAYPADSTSCRDASCAAGVATLAAGCDGAGRCPAVQTQPCSPYVCGATACLGNCAADGDCSSGDFCAAGVCTPKLAQGASCGGPNQCATGFCVDGVCCDTACGGQCQACDVTGSAGTCTAVAGSPHGSRPACATDGSSCGGSCDGSSTGACAYPGASAECRAASCTSGVATLAAACDGAGNCPAVQTQSCTPYVCGSSACLGNCAVDSECAAGDYCGAGVCTLKLDPGTRCGGANQCATGFCVDSVCCDAACNGQCQACDAAGSIGTCSPVIGAPHNAPGARPDCVGDGSACGGACDGSSTSACAYPGASVECRAASCAGGAATLAAACDGAGRCPDRQTQSCAPYVCGPSACLGNCGADSDCATGDFCNGGVCTPKLGRSASCGGPNQCATGLCVDHVCCDTACNGQCEACDAPGAVGTCTAVIGAPHGARPLCASDGPKCGGTCDGSSAIGCNYPTSSTSCGSASCSSGTATAAVFCDGVGHCPARQTQSCGGFACDGAQCRTACRSDAECTERFWCFDGTCRARDDRRGLMVRGSGGGCSQGGAGAFGPLALVLALLVARCRRRGLATAALLVALGPALARAQEASTSFAVQRFQPAAGAYDVLGLSSARIPEHLDLSGVVYLNYADRPLRLLAQGSPSFELDLVGAQTALDVGVSLALFGRAEVSLVVPLTVSQSSRAAGDIPTAPGGGASDIRLVPKVALFDEGPLALAAAMPVSLPVASSGYLGLRAVTATPTAIVEWQGPRGLRGLANIGIALRGRRALLDLTVGSALAGGLGAEMPFTFSGQRFHGMATVQGEADFGSGAVGAPLELLLALRWNGPRGVAVTLGGGPGLTDGYGSPRYRLLAAVSLAPMNFFRSAKEAPPEASKPRDSAPEPVAVAAAPLAATAEAPPPAAPPPDAPPPAETAAPPEPPPAPAAAPSPAPSPDAKVALRNGRIAILEPVHFASDRDVILPDSFDLLAQLAKVLVDNPWVTKVRVEGHTDSKGSAKHNLDLSDRRARAVRQRLVGLGVAPARLESKGYGPSRPVDSNLTEAGRGRNRRVEFVIVGQEPLK